MKPAVAALCAAAERAVRDGYNILVLSDRAIDADHVPIPALLATAAVHHHLVRMGLRTESGLVVETGAVREVHHFAVLAGYGAEAINPYLAFDTLSALRPTLPEKIAEAELHKRYIKSVCKGLLKVMSKMGISTYQSYCGAQIFDAVGLASEFVDTYFTGTASRIEGVGLAEIAEESVRWHRDAFGANPIYESALDVGGDYAFRIRGEAHAWTPDSIAQAAARHARQRLEDLRGVLADHQRAERAAADPARPVRAAPRPPSRCRWRRSSRRRRSSSASPPAPCRFGSISYEAHTNLAIAMNRIGGKSNTGEGGEEPERFQPLADGSPNPARSAIKQVASGRFGVTTEYLVNADDLQIKMAQGAKPGEGGQLPGHKVSKQIARVRHSTPGRRPDLAAAAPRHLLDRGPGAADPRPQERQPARPDLREAGLRGGRRHRRRRASSKAHADHVTISGYEGGTGASPLTSIKHAGSPWEIGLAETHQTLVLNRLRGRIAVQVDGGIRTGRDVVIGALLGADEFGFATAPLVVSGCIMMRKCHLNTCPVGVATQDPELRKRFTGKPEHVVNYFFFVAEEVRRLMARLGFRRFTEMIGRDRPASTCAGRSSHWKAKGLDFSRILHLPPAGAGVAINNCEQQDHGLDRALDHELIRQARPALERGEPVRIEVADPQPQPHLRRHALRDGRGALWPRRPAGRHDPRPGSGHRRAVLRRLARARRHARPAAARPTTTSARGSRAAASSCGRPPARRWPAPRTTSSSATPCSTAPSPASASSAGVAGERFAVRNSGATAVVEGVGDHGCEYMTGGVRGHASAPPGATSPPA